MTLYVLRDGQSGAVCELFDTAAEARKYLRTHREPHPVLEGWDDDGRCVTWRTDQLAAIIDGSAFGIYD